MTPKPDHNAAIEALITKAVAPLVAEVAALTARIEVLITANSGPRDKADLRLRRAIVEHSHGLDYRATDLLVTAVREPDLAAALKAADIVNEWQLGKLLRRFEQGPSIDNVRFERTGRMWRCVLVLS
jgi:hypothetical protein